jgi:hypothetical protein
MKLTVTCIALVALCLAAGPLAAQQQLTGTGDFCIKGATGSIRCEYQTMAQCDEARPQGAADQCIARSQAAGTTAGPALREQPNSPAAQKD